MLFTTVWFLRGYYFITRSRNNVVSIATRLQAEQAGIWIPPSASDVSIVQNDQTGSGALSATYSMDTNVHPPR